MTIPLEEKVIVEFIENKLQKDCRPYNKELLGQYVANKIIVVKQIAKHKKKEIKTTITKYALNGWVNWFILHQERD